MSKLLLVAMLGALCALSPGQQPLRLTTWNVQALDSPGSVSWNRAVSILQRIGADIVAVQEIDTSSEVSDFPVFASQAGFAHTTVSSISGTLSGNLYLGVMSVHPIVNAMSHSAADLSGDPNANDITRDILEAHIQVPNTNSVLGVFTVHLKASTPSINNFRRAVEMRRLGQAIDNFVQGNPGAPWVALGDFNEDLGDGPFANTFNSLPSGLPQTYQLGNDVSFPVFYDPFNDLLARGALIANATQEDSTTIYETRQTSGRRLDYLFHAGGTLLIGDEVYNSTRDNGFDDPPVGNWLPKPGTALPATYSSQASDHHPVFADVTVPSPPSGPLYPGTNEDFVMGTGVNGVISYGSGNEIKQATAGDILLVHYFSPAGTYNYEIPLIAAQTFLGFNVPNGNLPGMQINTSGAFLIYSGIDPSGTGFNQGILPFTGNSHAFLVPTGLTGVNVMLQGYALSANTANGFFATSDGYIIEIQ